MRLAKTYKIERVAGANGHAARGDVIATVETDAGANGVSDVYPLRHYKYHSDSFEFGYGGSGPADLALSILLDHFGEWPTKAEMDRGDSRAWHAHQAFKAAFVAQADEPGFTLTSEQIDVWLTGHQA